MLPLWPICFPAKLQGKIGFSRSSKEFTRDKGGAALTAEDLATDPAVMSPSEVGELAGALVALQRDVVRHPVLTEVGLGLAAPGQEAAQLGEVQPQHRWVQNKDGFRKRQRRRDRPIHQSS